MPASYTDSYEYAFDSKGRITIPAQWRGDGFEKRLYAINLRPGGVSVFPQSWLDGITENMSKLRLSDPLRIQMQELYSRIQQLEWDQQGRVLLKEKYRSEAGIRKEARLVGCGSHFEIKGPEEAQPQEAAGVSSMEILERLGV